MKQTSVFLLILLTLFGSNQLLAQKRTKPKEVIVLKFMIPNRTDYARFEVPVNKIFSEDNELGQVSIDECLNPANEECRKSVYSTYEASANTFSVNKNKSRVIFRIEVTDGCTTRKVFDVSRKRLTKIQLDCEVELIAYYGIEKKEAN